MIVELLQDDAGAYWRASGDGPLRDIVVEATTRALAVRAYEATYARQYAESEAMTAASIERDQEIYGEPI